MEKMRVILALSLVIALSIGMMVSAHASGGDVNFSTSINGQHVQVFFPAGSEAAVAYNRDVRPLLPNRPGRMSDAAIAAKDDWIARFVSSQSANNPLAQPAPQTSVIVSSDSPNIPQLTTKESALEVVRLVNLERERVGLHPLAIDERLVLAAELRASEVVRYFSHTRPCGSHWRTAIEDYHTFNGRGENIARNMGGASDVMARWLNSEGHRNNILRESYKYIGVGVTANGGWVQLFGR